MNSKLVCALLIAACVAVALAAPVEKKEPSLENEHEEKKPLEKRDTEQKKDHTLATEGEHKKEKRNTEKKEPSLENEHEEKKP